MLDLQSELELVDKQIVSLIARIAERRDQIDQLERAGRPTANARALLQFMEGVLAHRHHYRLSLQEAINAKAKRA